MKSTHFMKLKTTLRVLFFCMLCASGLALFSGLLKNLPIIWSQHLILLVTIFFTLGLIPVFVKWEGIHLSDVGVIPTKSTIKKVTIGFLSGLLMTLFQLVFVYLLGHYSIELTTSFSLVTILISLTLYFLVAIREELAFRSYPIFSLNSHFGLRGAQLIITLVFSLEHILGGMNWCQAFLGAGTGALLFGLAAIRTKGIAFPIGIHFAWNFGQWCLGFKKETGILHGIVAKGFESIVERNAWIGYILIMTVAISITYFHKPTSE